jgi:DNA-binding PadR family transcriptional regulator
VKTFCPACAAAWALRPRLPDVTARPTDIEAELPLTEASFLILLALAEQPMHGYLIMQTINLVFRTSLQMGPGTLYRTLQLQLKGGLIREFEGEAENGEDPRRRNYAITRRGREIARRELARLRALWRLGNVRMGASHADA